MSKKLRETHWQATFNFQEKAVSVWDSFLARIPVHTGEQVCFVAVSAFHCAYVRPSVCGGSVY